MQERKDCDNFLHRTVHSVSSHFYDFEQAQMEELRRDYLAELRQVKSAFSYHEFDAPHEIDLTVELAEPLFSSTDAPQIPECSQTVTEPSVLFDEEISCAVPKIE